jgi:hypothetical protein
LVSLVADLPVQPVGAAAGLSLDPREEVEKTLELIYNHMIHGISPFKWVHPEDPLIQADRQQHRRL